MSKRRVLLSRSAKAASWGRELAAAASAAGDSRTAVEGAAYASWLEGLAAMERAPGAGKRGGDGSSVVDAEASAAAWSSALEALARAGELCSRLAASSAGFGSSEKSSSSSSNTAASPADARAAARAQAADIAPLVRFCQHQLGRADAGADPERVAAAAAEGAGAASGPKVKAALEELRAGEGKDDDFDDSDDASKKERPSSSSSSSSSTFSWRGSSFAVPSERARSALATAQAALADARKVDDDDDVARLAALDRALAAFGDAKGIVRQQQQQQAGGGAAATTGAAAAAAAASSSVDAARAAADARSLALAVTGAALDAALERGRLAASLLSRALDGGEKEAATIFKVKQAALAAAGTTPETAATTASASDDATASDAAEKKRKQQRRRAAAAAKRPPKPEDAVRAYASLAKTAKQLGEVAAALGGTTGELLLDEAAALGADAAARRTFWAARAFLAARRCPDAMALLDRARERAEAAAEAHEECSCPDGAAVSSLRSLAEDACPGWRAVAHAEAAARTARGVRAAGNKVAGLKVASAAGKKQKKRGASEDGNDDGDDDDEEEDVQEQKRPFLMDRLDEWASCAPTRIAPIPPRLEIVPVRPFVLDVAFDGVVPPDVSKRAAAGGGGRRASASRGSSAGGASSASAATASEEESTGTLSKLAGAFGWGSK